jgi:protein-disulfide isomerase
MNDTNESKGAQSTVGVPVAIVIAGGLIAAAIYFGNAAGGLGTAPVDGGAADVAVAPQAADGEPAVAAVGDIRPVDDRDHIRGPENAKVTVIEYSDIECPFCKRFHPTMTQLLTEYPNDVRWVWRHFPLEQLHPDARIAAIATECAGEQGKFWELLDSMMEDGIDLAEAKLPALAQAAGVTNSAQFKSCLSDEKYNQKVDDDIADAAAAGGQGTPYSVVIGADGEKEAISGAQPYAAVKAAVDKHL